MPSRLALLSSFVEDDCIPAETVFAREMAEIESRTGSRWAEIPDVLTKLKAKARSLGLWNLFMPEGHQGSANVPMQEYAQMSELMGRSSIAPEACNCSAPDTGNMEVFANYGSAEQKSKWLTPLLEGTIRSAFLMTEPAVASSDATNIACDIRRAGDTYVINGRKWWSSGAMDPRCKVAIVMCRHRGAEWFELSKFLGTTMLRTVMLRLSSGMFAFRYPASFWAKGGASRSLRGDWGPAGCTIACAP
eukprot:g19357.t1